jgi:hypothetical protein
MLGIAVAAVFSAVTTTILVLFSRKPKHALRGAPLVFGAGVGSGLVLGMLAIYLSYRTGIDLRGFRFGGVYYGGSVVVIAIASVCCTVLMFLCYGLTQRYDLHRNST